MTDTLALVGENAEQAATHLHFLGVAFARLGEQMTTVGQLLAALKPYTPASMRHDVFMARLGLYNACEEVADAGSELASDYLKCLLLAQDCASTSLEGKRL